MKRYLTIVLFVVSCTNGTTKDKCNPVGKWELTIETATGDCLQPGQKETFDLTVTKADKKELNSDCSGSDFLPLEYAETEQDFGISGLLEFEITFEGNSLLGTGLLNADLTLSGELVDVCYQEYLITGHRE